MTDPKFTANSIVKGKNYGTFAIFGSRYSEVLGEWLYEVRQIDEDQNLISAGMNMVESSFA